MLRQLHSLLKDLLCIESKGSEVVRILLAKAASLSWIGHLLLHDVLVDSLLVNARIHTFRHLVSKGKRAHRIQSHIGLGLILVHQEARLSFSVHGEVSGLNALFLVR